MWQILVIVACLVLNALIAATEFAFIAVKKHRLKKLAAEGHKEAEQVLALRENPERTLSILQLGITFIGTVAAAFGGAEIGGRLTEWFHDHHGWSRALSQIAAILLFVVPYTYINVVFSELLPKSLALKNPKWVIFHFNKWLIFFDRFLSPVVSLLEKSTKGAVKLFFSWVNHQEPENEELVSVSKVLRPYMLNLTRVEKQCVADAMIPWEEVDVVTEEMGQEEVKALILKTGHTRLPVVNASGPKGLLLSKKFWSFYEKGEEGWQNLIQPMIRLDEKEKLLEGLRQMQSAHSHMCLVMKEEKPLGIVTIEDILEEIVGEIYDEDDRAR